MRPLNFLKNLSLPDIKIFKMLFGMSRILVHRRIRKIQRANDIMNAGDRGNAKHAMTCSREIDWENAKIVGNESRWTQRNS